MFVNFFSGKIRARRTCFLFLQAKLVSKAVIHNNINNKNNNMNLKKKKKKKAEADPGHLPQLRYCSLQFLADAWLW